MFRRLHAQAAKVYARKPKPGAGTAPFYTKPSVTEQAAKRQRTDEASASGAQPNLPPDAGKSKAFYSLLPLSFPTSLFSTPGPDPAPLYFTKFRHVCRSKLIFFLEQTWKLLSFLSRVLQIQPSNF